MQRVAQAWIDPQAAYRRAGARRRLNRQRKLAVSKRLQVVARALCDVGRLEQCLGVGRWHRLPPGFLADLASRLGVSYETAWRDVRERLRAVSYESEFIGESGLTTFRLKGIGVFVGRG